MLSGGRFELSDALRNVEVGLDGGDHVSSDLILDIKDVAQLAIVSLGPDMLTRRRVDQLPCDADASSRSSNTTLKDVANPKLSSHISNIDGSTLVGKGRVSCDNEEPAQARKCRGDILGYPVSEVLLLGIAAHI